MDNKISGLSIIVPSYNEEDAVGGVIERLQGTVKKIKGRECEIIIVDDGSKDKTADVASRYNIKLLRHPKNLGYGKAIVTGIENSKYDLIVIIDADNTYEPEEIDKMLPYMENFDMVIGVRDMSGIKQSFILKILRIFLKSIIFYFTGYQSPDPNSGFRIFKKDIAIRGGNLFSLKFSFSTSLTFYAHLTNRFVRYVPIKYNPRIGFSKVRHVRDSFRTFMLILRMALMQRPLKCFATHIAISMVGVLMLLCLKPFLSLESWITLIITWFLMALFIALGFISFIFSQIYATLQNRK